MTTNTVSGPIEGYLQIEPDVTREGDVATIDAKSVYYKYVNEAVRSAFAGNTMNAGNVVVHGDAGDVLGYGMRGGRVFIKGDVGYRVGIHMKAYEDLRPIMICGGKARDFFGEYMAGGLLVLLGMNSRLEGPLVGGYLGTGMHGGEIFVRGEVESWQCGKEVGVFTATEEDLEGLRPVLSEYCEAFGMDIDEVLSEPFTRLVPVSHRPYGKLYTYL